MIWKLWLQNPRKKYEMNCVLKLRSLLLEDILKEMLADEDQLKETLHMASLQNPQWLDHGL